jgi:hypothetical protein
MSAAKPDPQLGVYASRRSPYTTDVRRAALGILAGAAVGSASQLPSFLSHAGFAGLLAPLAVFVIGTLVWALGILFFASLPWSFLDASGRRRWWHAALLGAGLMLVPASLTLTGGVSRALLFMAEASALGALIGLVIWRVAYRRVALNPRKAGDLFD